MWKKPAVIIFNIFDVLDFLQIMKTKALVKFHKWRFFFL